METANQPKTNILKKISKKMRRRNIAIAVTSITVCLLAVIITYFMLFVRQVPIDASEFTNVRVDTKLQTINQISDNALEYSQLKFYMENIFDLSVYANRQYYLEKNNDAKSASIYFYYSQTAMQKNEATNRSEQITKELEEYAEAQGENYKEEIAQIYLEDMEGVNSNILVSPQLFRTDLEGALREITKVYYLVYDYDNLSNFETAKTNAVLLWEK